MDDFTRNNMEQRDFELGQQIAKLEGIVIEGFKGVHNRQDIANGRTSKIEDRVSILEKKQFTNAGKIKGISLVWGVAILLVPIVISIIALFQNAK